MGRKDKADWEDSRTTLETGTSAAEAIPDLMESSWLVNWELARLNLNWRRVSRL
jgi:hypothetical protein